MAWWSSGCMPIKSSALEDLQASVNLFYLPKRDSVTSDDSKMLQSET